MKAKVTSDYEYERNQPPEESFFLEVEGAEEDKPEDVAATYLELRLILKDGIDKED